MKIQSMAPDEKPSFCWDRDWTVADIKARLRVESGFERLRLIAWILREGTYDEIWNLLQPQQVYAMRDELLPMLGRKKEYWRYTLDVWHRMGKI